MRKYFVVACVAALATSCLLLIGIHVSTPLAKVVASQKSTQQISSQLADDPAFVSSLQSQLSATTVKGQKGDTGNAGTSGNNGVNGASGSSGVNGASGTNGNDGTSGSNGTDGINGTAGATGARGATGAAGATGAQGPAGATGAQGIQGAQGVQGLQGATGTQGVAGLISTTATGLTYNATSQNISLTTGYAIPASSDIANWNTAYAWGNPALAGYALQNGQAGGQKIIGGTAANNALTFQANSATTGNTGTAAAISLKVGNSGGTTALTVLNNGYVGIGTATPGSPLTVEGNVAITTTGSDTIAPFQFVQITGLADNPTITSFNSTSYSVSDWNPAVVGFADGGSCGTNWSGGTLNGMEYWWSNNGGNWQLTIDMSGPNDGCNKVQVMFVRKEFSTRTNYGF